MLVLQTAMTEYNNFFVSLHCLLIKFNLNF